VRDHQGGGPGALDRIAKAIEDGAGGAFVEIPCGLVGEQQSRRVGQRPGDRGALHLAARERGRATRLEAAQPHGGEHRGCALAARASTRAEKRQRERDVFGHGEVRQQVEGLEHEPEVTPAPEREGIVVGIVDHVAVEAHFAAIGTVEPGDHVEQRGLAGTGLAHDRHPFTGSDREIDAIEERFSGRERPTESPGLEHLATDRLCNVPTARW
jgi:hypothetical protein